MAQLESSDITTLASEIESRVRALTSLRTAEIRALRREFSKRITKASAKDVVELALLLLSRGAIEYRFLAYELVCHHRPALQSLGTRELERLGRGLDSWGAVDMFACYLSGPAWREHQVPNSVIHRWARSRDRWWRRAALVSTVPLNNKARGGTGDSSRTLEVCRMLADDRDDMVVKALSWALRALAIRDPKAVSEFLESQKTVIAPRVRRETQNKLSTGLKNPRGRADRIRLSEAEPISSFATQRMRLFRRRIRE
jgi:3-methyladenine DNA glycosylase AlkD